MKWDNFTCKGMEQYMTMVHIQISLGLFNALALKKYSNHVTTNF